MTGRRPITDPDRQAAHGRLMAALLAHAAAGRSVPCTDPSARWAWTQDDDERTDADARDLAARLCATCPALTACEAYVTDYPEEAGIWAGLTPRQRRAHGRSAA